MLRLVRARAMYLAPIFLLPAILLVEATTAVAECPPDTAFCDGAVVSTEPTFAFYCTTAGSYGYAYYDWLSGYVQAFVPGQTYGYAAGLAANDDFHVVGPIPGEALNFKANVRVAANGCRGDFVGSGTAYFTVWVGTAPSAGVNVSSYGAPGRCSSISTTLSILISVAEGTPFRVRMEAGSTGSESGSGHAEGTLFFSELPGGYSIQSCQGFRQDFVPVRAASWGSIKIRYR